MEKKTIIFDLDKTLCTKKEKNETYSNVKPIKNMIDILNELHDQGYEIIIETARNMLTQNNDETKVIKNVGKQTLDWLDKYNVKYDGIKFAKTFGLCYVDDKAIRPDELAYLKEIGQLNNISEYLDNQNNLNILNNSIDYLFSKHYVYQWYYFDKNNAKHVFYVGKGTKMKAWDININQIFNDIYKNNDCSVEIVKLFDNPINSFELETKLIDYYTINGQCEACKFDI